MSLLGNLRFERAYYYCPRCRHGHCPWDQTLGLKAGDLTPASEEVVSLAGLLSSFAEAAEKVLPRLANLRLAESTIERTTEDAGQRLGRFWASGQTLGPPLPWRWQRDAQGRTCAYVSVDATGIGQQGPDGAKADGRMVWLGQVFNPAAAGSGQPWQCRVLAGLWPLAELGEPLRRQAAQVGMETAEVWIGLTDGGNGLEAFVQQNFNRPNLVLILDFYHVAEHLNELAKVWQRGDATQAQAVASAWCHTLKHEGGVVLLSQLEALDLRGRSVAARQKYAEVTGYVRKNVHRMKYPEYQAQGWLIGSGHIEAACKGVIGQRMKGNGMRWGEEGGNGVCQLRALYKTEKGQWEAFWTRAA